MNRWLLLVGVAQGWLLWGLWKARELKVWPAVDPVSERILLYLFLAVPLAFYLTQNIPALTRAARIKILAGIGTLFALLGGYSGWAENIPTGLAGGMWNTPPARPSDLLAAAVLGFVVIPLLAHLERAPRRWRYHALFETAWRNALLTISSATLTGVFWVVLFAGAMLMKSIGLNFVYELIEKPIFSIPVTGMIFGAAFGLGLARADMIVMLRRFWLTISAWLLPLLLAFSVMWTAALPFTGLEMLFKTHNAAFILLWFIALSVNFANAAYQDGSGEQPYGRWLGKALEYAWLTLLALAAVAWWAMQQRIVQYGWTEDRVWGAFVLLIATLYTAGYAWSVRTGRGWLANIGKTNIATALVMCAGLVLLLSPLADARRIAVASQMDRLLSGATGTDKIDYSYLRWHAGRYGRDALEQLSQGIAHPDKDTIASRAKQALAQQNRYSDTSSGAAALSTGQMRQRLHVLPKDMVLDEALIRQMQAAARWEERRCLETDAQCVVWMLDLNGDGLKEAIVMKEEKGWSGDSAIFYQQTAKGQYRYGGTLAIGYGMNDKQRAQMMADIGQNRVKAVAPRFNDIEIGGRRIGVTADQSVDSGEASCDEQD
ncbi:MAG TPA: DUF4153 domain-containing protein [Gallionella sp.]